MAQEIARAWVQIVPTAQGIEGSIAGLLGDEAEAAGTGAGNRFGEAFKSVAGMFVDAIKGIAESSLGFLKDSVGVGMEFDSAMSQVAATMGVSVDSIATLRDFAQEMGSTTAFSATQAAEALNYMALAGYDANTSMEMLPTVLNLAAAGGIGLAEASDMVTDASSALGLSIDETKTMVDQMAAASSSSNTSVEQLGNALLTVGGTAKDLQGGVLEASTALGILADNGIKGAEGGTALRNIMLSLEAPTDKAAAAMGAIGLNAFDANGNMRPLNETFADLNGILSSMTNEQRTNVLNTLFNKVDLKSVNALLANTGESVQLVNNSYETANVNWEKIAGKMSKTFGTVLSTEEAMGDVSSFIADIAGSGYEGADAINELAKACNISTKDATELWSVYEAGQAQVDTMAKKIEASGVDWEKYAGTSGFAARTISTNVRNMSEDIVLSLTEYGRTADETAQLLVDAYGIDLSDAQAAVLAVTGTVEAQGSRWDELTGKINDSTGAAQAMADTQLDNLEGDITLFQSALEGAQIAIADQLTPTLREFVQFGGEGLSELTEAFKEGGFAGAMDALGEIIADGLTMLLETVPKVIELGAELLMSLVQGIIDNLPAIVEAALQCVVMLSQGLSEALPELIPGVVSVVMEIVAVLVENAPLLIDAGLALITGLAQGLINSIPDLVQRIPDVIQGLIVGFVTHAPLMIEAAVELILALAGGLIGAIPDLIMAVPEIIGATVLALKEGVPQFIESGKHLIEGIGQGFVDAVTYIVDRIKEIGERIVQGFKDFFGIHSPSTLMAEIGGYLIEGIVQGISETWHLIIDFFAGVWQGVIEGAQVLIEGIGSAFGAAKDAAVTTWEGIKDAFSTILQGLQSVFEGLAQWMGQTFDAAKQAAVNAWQNVSEAFGSVIESIKGVFEGIGEWIGEKFTAARDAAVNAWNGVKEMFANIWTGIQSVFEGVGEWFNKVFTEAKEVIATVWQNVGEAFAEVWESIQAVFDGVAEWFGETFTAAKDAAVNAWEAVTEAFQGIWEGIQGVFAAVGEWFSETFAAARDMAAAAWETIVDAFTTIKENIVKVYEDLSERLGAFFDAAKERAIAAWQNVHEAFITIKENIQNAFNGFIEWAGEHFNKAKEKAVGAWKDIKSKFSDVWKKIKEAFNLKDATQWGKDMINNFVNGIKSAASSVTAAVSSVAEKVKSRLGFSEPDEGPLSDFHTYAPDMMDLFVSGIMDNIGAVQSALDEALAMTTPTIDVSRVEAITAGDSAISAGELDTGTTTTAASEVSYNFYSPKALDPVSAMREARKASQRMTMAYV